MAEEVNYTVHEYAAVNRHVDEVVAREKELTRFKRQKSNELLVRNVTIFLMALGVFAVLASFAYWIFMEANPQREGAETIVEIVKEVPVEVIKEVPVYGDSGNGSGGTTVIEKSIVIEREVPVPIEIEVGGDAITDFTIFVESKTNIDGIDEVITGANYSSSSDQLPYYQWCYTVNARNNVSSAQVKLATKEGRGKVTWLDISSDDAKQYGSSVEHLDVAKDFCSFIFEPAQPKQKKVTPKDRENVQSSGTGFFIDSDGYLVTNEHVVSKCSVIWVDHIGGEIPVNLVASNKQRDLALLKVQENGEFHALEFSVQVTSGQDVIAFGYPLGDALGHELKVTKGNISAMSGLKGDPDFMQFTAPIQSGNSGGPLLDYAGAVAGMSTATLRGEEFQNINFAIKGSEIQEFIAKNGAVFNASSGPTLEVEPLVEIAKKATVQIKCY